MGWAPPAARELPESFDSVLVLLRGTANLGTRVLDFRGFDSGGILTLRGGILMSTGNFPEMSSQQNLSRDNLVGRLGISIYIYIYTYIYIYIHICTYRHI